MSTFLIEKLARLDENVPALQGVWESLLAPKRFHDNDAIQEDAVKLALSTFGIESKDRPVTLYLPAGKDSALARININEDSVIEHDARDIPGFSFDRDDLTGWAVFNRGNERLEVFTANKRPLEKCFGVDLIYLNSIQKNIVMLQYKMLDPLKSIGETDWIYRPDTQLDKEIVRMKKFDIKGSPVASEYRFNQSVFYLKFVKRDGLLSGANVIVPLDHFELLRKDPSSR